jgi:hypothetical protein
MGFHGIFFKMWLVLGASLNFCTFLNCFANEDQLSSSLKFFWKPLANFRIQIPTVSEKQSPIKIPQYLRKSLFEQINFLESPEISKTFLLNLT